MNLFQLLLEAIVGKLVLDLPEEDQVTINEMLKKHYGIKENAKVQKEDNATNGL